MTSISSSRAVQSGFQQLSVLTAKKNAAQAEQQAQTLRKQANAAQAEADKYEVKAQTLDSQANKAETKSDNAKLGLNLADSFQRVGKQVSDTMQNATVRETGTYSSRGIQSTVAIDNNRVVGVNIDTRV